MSATIDKIILINELTTLLSSIKTKLDQYNTLAREIQQLRTQINRLHETGHYAFANFDVECPVCQETQKGGV